MVEEYRIESKEEKMRLVKGEWETYFRIWATSKGGTYFHADIPEDIIASKEKTEAIISKRAKELDAI